VNGNPLTAIAGKHSGLPAVFRARLLSAREVTFAWRARVPAALGPGFVDDHQRIRVSC